MEDLQPIDLDSLNPDPGPEESGGLAYVMRGGRRLRQREYAPYIPTPMERRIKAAVMAGTGPGEPVDPNMVTSAGVGAVIGGMGSPSVLANPARIDRAKKIAATLDIPFAVAYDNEAGYAKALETHVPDFWKEAGKSTLRAIGSSYVGLGHGMEMLGYSRESADVYRSFGRQMQDTYATHIKPQEFTLSRVADPAWWATTVVEGLTSSLSLVPGALVAGYTGMVLGPAIGLGTFGTTVLAALGATAASRPFEAILEASQTKEQLIREGWDEGLADKQAEFVFQQNMRLGVADVAQIVTAFTPMTRMMSQAASQVLAKRVGAAALKFTGLGASEAIEEIWQQGIQQAAIEGGSVIEKVRRMNPEMREAGVIGALMGYGLGGAGSAYNALTSHVESRLSRPVADKYEEAILARKAQGMDDHSAKLSALDEVAGTPEGKKDIQDAIIELKDIVEGRPAAETDKETMDRAVDAYIKSQENQPDIVPPTDIEELTNEETLDAVARGEVSIDEVLGVEPEISDVAQPGASGTGLESLAGMAAGMREGFIDSAWKRLSEGKRLLFSDRRGIIEHEIQRAFDAGLIKSRDDIAAIYAARQSTPASAPAEGVPAFISQSRKQELADLGYSLADIAQMTPAQADEIVSNQATATAKPQPAAAPAPLTLRPAIRVDGEVKFTDPTGNTHAQVANMMVEAWKTREISPDAVIESGWIDERGNFLTNQDAIARREADAKAIAEEAARAGETAEQTATRLNLPQDKLEELKPGKINPEAILPLMDKMAVRETETGEKKAVAGFDPRLVKILGGNLYSGDLGVIAMKEMIQNAVDSVRGVPNGQVKVTYDAKQREIYVVDNGHGMLPEVVTKELVDIGGSAKQEGASGGFGIAKVAIFANAKNITVITSAKRPDGKYAVTGLEGSGQDWIDPEKGLNVSTDIVDTFSFTEAGEASTGTSIIITLNDEVELGNYSAVRFAQSFVDNNRLGIPVSIEINGKSIEPREVMKPKPLTVIDRPTYSIEILAGDAVERAQWKTISVLNNGLPQFDQEVTLPNDSTPLPISIVANVKTKVSPELPGYPFQADRQHLSQGAEQDIKDYIIGEMFVDNAKKERDRLRSVLTDAPLIGQTGDRLVDTSGIVPPAVIEYLRAQPHTADGTRLMKAVYQNVLEALKAQDPNAYTNANYHGIGLGLSSNWSGTGYLGVNISGAALSDSPTAPNFILMNPYIVALEVKNSLDLGVISQEEAAEHFKGAIAETIVHELTHQVARGHEEQFAGKLTRNVHRAAKAVVAAMRMPDRSKIVDSPRAKLEANEAEMMRLKAEMELYGENAIINTPTNFIGESLYERFLWDYQRYLAPIQSKAGTDLFGKISTASTRQVLPGSDQDDVGGSKGRRSVGRQEAVRGGGESAAPGVAPGADMGSGRPAVTDRFISEEAYQAAKAALKEKLSGLRAGFDPTALGNMITIGAYHIENGLRTFSAWSKQMLADHGPDIQPYLQSIWDSAKAIVDLKAAVREAEGATQPAREVKPQVRRATGQNVVAKMIREDEALRAAMKKAEQASRIAWREGNKDGIAQAKADIRDIVIRAKVKAELFGFREGFNVAQRLTTKEMSQAFREDIKRREQTAKAMVDLIQEQLPPHLRGKLLDAVADRMTNGHINETLDRIEQMRTRNIKKELIEEINEFKNYKGDLDIQYKKRLDELLEDINTKNISAKTMRKLKSFMDWADENGMPSGIGAKMRANIERYSKTQAQDLTIEELTEIRDLAKHLVEMGKLKRRLKLRYDERERDKAIERVLSTTQNMDYEYSGEDTNLDKLKKTALYTYLQQRSPLRVGRRMDGNIWGENTKMFQKISYADSDAQAETRKRTKEAMLKIHEVAPDIDWTDDDTNHRIAVNVYAAMPNTDPQVLILMEKFGWQEIPELNAQEKAAVQILVKEVGARQDVLAAMTEELYNREFVKVPNYFPFKYEGEFHANPVDGVLQTAHMTQSAYHGMTEERKQHVLKTLRTDVLGIFEQAINEQEWFIHVQPALDDVRQVVTSHRFHEAAGDAGTNYWLEHLDIVARRGWTTAASKANQSPWARILKVSRKNIAVGILAFRPTTILLQPTAIFPALAYVNTEFGPKAAAYVAGEFIKMWTIPGHFNKVFEKGQALQNRKAGDVSVEDLLAEARTGSATDRFTRYGMGWIIAADVRTAAGVQQGIENYLTEMGVPDAHLEAETVMQLVSASSDVSLRPHMFARGEFARTMLTFQSFISNTWDILADDIVRRGLIQGDVSKKIAALVGIGLFVMAKMSEDEIRKFYYMVIGRGIRKEKDTPFIVDATFGMMSNYPVLGAAFDMMSSRGGAADIPLNKLINDMIGGAIVGPLTATEKTKAETIQKGILRGVKAGAIVFGGRPGTGPIFDVLEGILFPEQDRSGKPGPMKLKGAQ